MGATSTNFFGATYHSPLVIRCNYALAKVLCACNLPEGHVLRAESLDQARLYAWLFFREQRNCPAMFCDEPALAEAWSIAAAEVSRHDEQLITNFAFKY